MKHFVLMFMAVLSIVSTWGQNYSGQNYKIDNVNADDAVVGYVEEIIAKNIQQGTTSLFVFKLSQDGDAFSIEYNVSPDGINGVAKTDDVWSELEATVLKALGDIKKQISKVSVAEQKAIQPEQKQSKSQQQSAQQPMEQHEPVQQKDDKKQNVKDIYSDWANDLADGIIQRVEQSIQQENVQQQPTQQYQNQAQNVPNNASNYNNMASQYYDANYYASGSVSIGGLMRFQDGSQGIVFYLDGQGHGLAVSLDMTTAQWQNTSKKKDCLNIAQIPDGDGENICIVGLGKRYSSAVISQLGYGMAPAIEWCTRHGNGWYLPSAGELAKLFSTEKETKKMISTSLKQFGGAGLADEWHWSSSENDKDEAINVSSSGWTTSEDKIEVLHVRAVRAF